MVKSKKSKKNLKTVSFDEEFITKDSANEVLSKVKQENEIRNVDKPTLKAENEEIVSENGFKNKKAKRIKSNKQEIVNLNNNDNQETQLEKKVKHKKRKLETNKKDNLNQDGVENQDENTVVKPEEKKVKRKKKKPEVEIPEQSEATDEISLENPKVKTGESIRAQKRKKHANLLEEKRLKVEVSSQQNALNYLSKWKHCPKEWKFEKLKQIWLQQNLFDTSKIPNEFWETAVEYFNGSKGFIRKVVLRDALKIIEKEENTEEENTDENYLLILERARNIVQSLQE